MNWRVCLSFGSIASFLSFGSILSTFCPNSIITEPCFADEKIKLQEAHKAEVAKLIENHEAEIAKLIADQEDELEKRVAEVLEAKQHAQKVEKAHKLANRDYERAKESASLQAKRMKAMEKEEESWINFLKALDKQLSGKFFLRHFSDTKLLSLLLNNLPLVFTQRLSLPPMHGPPMLSKRFGRSEPKRPLRTMRGWTLSGALRIGSIPCELVLPR